MLKKSLLATAMLLSSSAAFAADIENSNLEVAFQGAHFQGAGNQITMLRVPVTNKETGQTQFFDMSAEFAADKSGNLIFKKMSSVKSVAFGSANQLVAGHYLDDNNCSWFIEGPSVGSQGRSVWSIFKPPGNNKGCKDNDSYSGHVMSGPIKDNELIKTMSPYKELLKNTNQNLNYGVYQSDYVISASQSGKLVSFVAHSHSDARVRFNWTIMQAPYPGKKED